MIICNSLNKCKGGNCSTCSHGLMIIEQKYKSKSYYFTFNSLFGPLFTNKKYIDLKRQPGEKAPHWKAFELWYDKQKKNK